jgi:MFS family permease
LGIANVISIGAAAILGCVVVNEWGTALGQFWVALVLLGIGWNFMYVGGTTILPQAHSPGERAKAQAFNEFAVFGLVTAASLGAGLLQQTAGWNWVNLTVVPGIISVATLNLWMHLRKRTATA